MSGLKPRKKLGVFWWHGTLYATIGPGCRKTIGKYQSCKILPKPPFLVTPLPEYQNQWLVTETYLIFALA